MVDRSSSSTDQLVELLYYVVDLDEQRVSVRSGDRTPTDKPRSAQNLLKTNKSWSGPVSALEQALEDYLQLRRSLGHELAEAAWLLPGFVAYLDAHGSHTVTVEAALAWAQQAQQTPCLTSHFGVARPITLVIGLRRSGWRRSVDHDRRSLRELGQNRVDHPKAQLSPPLGGPRRRLTGPGTILEPRPAGCTGLS